MATIIELANSKKDVLIRRPCWTTNTIVKIWLLNGKLPEYGILLIETREVGRLPLCAFSEFNDFEKVKGKANANKRKRSGKKAAKANSSSRAGRTSPDGGKSSRG